MLYKNGVGGFFLLSSTLAGGSIFPFDLRCVFFRVRRGMFTDRLALAFAASPAAAPAHARAPAEQVDPHRLEPPGRRAARVRTDRLLPRVRRRHPAHHRPGSRSLPGAHRGRRFQQGITSLNNQYSIKHKIIIRIIRKF